MEDELQIQGKKLLTTNNVDGIENVTNENEDSEASLRDKSQASLTDRIGFFESGQPQTQNQQQLRPHKPVKLPYKFEEMGADYLDVLIEKRMLELRESEESKIESKVQKMLKDEQERIGELIIEKDKLICGLKQLNDALMKECKALELKTIQLYPDGAGVKDEKNDRKDSGDNNNNTVFNTDKNNDTTESSDSNTDTNINDKKHDNDIIGTNKDNNVEDANVNNNNNNNTNTNDINGNDKNNDNKNNGDDTEVRDMDDVGNIKALSNYFQQYEQINQIVEYIQLQESVREQNRKDRAQFTLKIDELQKKVLELQHRQDDFILNQLQYQKQQQKLIQQQQFQKEQQQQEHLQMSPQMLIDNNKKKISKHSSEHEITGSSPETKRTSKRVINSVLGNTLRRDDSSKHNTRPLSGAGNNTLIMTKDSVPTSPKTMTADQHDNLLWKFQMGGDLELLANVSEMEVKRQQALFRFIVSEQRYVSEMEHIKALFYDPLSDKEIMTKEHRDALFGDFDRFLETNRNFSSQLDEVERTQWPKMEDISSILIEFYSQIFSVYHVCLSKLRSVAQKLPYLICSNRQIADLVLSIRAKEGFTDHELAIALIKPLSRIPQYVTMTNDIKIVTPEDHPSYENICTAHELVERELGRIEFFLRSVMEKKKLQEIGSNLEWYLVPMMNLFQGSRRLIKEGNLHVMCIESKREVRSYYAFLFNDVVLLTAKRKVKNNRWRNDSMQPKGIVGSAKPYTVMISPLRLYTSIIVSDIPVHSTPPLRMSSTTRAHGTFNIGQRENNIETNANNAFGTFAGSSSPTPSSSNHSNISYIEFKPSFLQTYRIYLSGTNSKSSKDQDDQGNAAWAAMFTDHVTEESNLFQQRTSFISSCWSENENVVKYCKSKNDTLENLFEESEIARQEAIHAILKSLAKYSISLDNLIKHFFIPFSNLENIDVRRKSDYSEIYHKTQEFLRHNYSLLRNIQSMCTSSSPAFNDITGFLFPYVQAIEPLCVSYSQKVSNTMGKLAALRVSYNNFASLLSDLSIDIFGEHSQLIKILRHPTNLIELLRDLIEKTPSEHTSYKNIEK
eukprot:Pgem_evm1s6529